MGTPYDDYTKRVMADAYRLGALEYGAKAALSSMERRFMRAGRCVLCCPKPRHAEIVKTLLDSDGHVVSCPIRDLRRALAAECPAHLLEPTAPRGTSMLEVVRPLVADTLVAASEPPVEGTRTVLDPAPCFAREIDIIGGAPERA